jgi:hypothetical protein
MAYDPELVLGALLAQAAKRRRHYPPQTRGTPTVDGAVRHPLVGGGFAQHPFLPLYKNRAPRRSF